MIEIIGYISAFLLALCGIPELFNAVNQGNSALSWSFLLMWGFGEIFALIYVILKSKKVKLLPLLLNYLCNIVCIGAICAIKVL